jgi:hypothetical protein
MIHSINIDHRINLKRQISKLNTNDSYTHCPKKQRENAEQLNSSDGKNLRFSVTLQKLAN